jgi:hypothetical protein
VISKILATTCSLLAVAAVAFNTSPVCITRGAVSSSVVAFADIDLVLNRLNTALAELVSVRVIVSALPESSDTRIELTILVVNAGAVYSVVIPVVVKSTFAFVYTFAIT